MKKTVFIAIAVLSPLLSCKHSEDSSLEGTRTTVGYQGTDSTGKMPLTWFIAGQDKTCTSEILVPADLVQNIELAWTQASKMLQGVNLVPLDDTEKKDFKLLEVKLVVGSENVLLLTGCIGKAESASPDGGGQTQPVNVSYGNPGSVIDTRSCGVSSPAVERLKQHDLAINQLGCSENMLAGFALRSTHRQIKMTAKFSIKNQIKTFEVAPFDTSKLEIHGSIKASMSSFGAALLPLPPAVKAAASAVFERIGSPVFSAEGATTNTITPDMTYTKANDPDGPSTIRISKLAIKIARGIFQPACEEAQPLIGEGVYKKEDCQLRKLYPVGGLVETLEKYRSLNVVNCESGGAGISNFYAIAPVPKLLDATSNPPKKESDFLTLGQNPSKLQIYAGSSGATEVYKRVSWATYGGEATKGDKCGKLNAEHRCVEFKSGFNPSWNFGKGVSCADIKSKKANLILSLATEPWMQLKKAN